MYYMYNLLIPMHIELIGICGTGVLSLLFYHRVGQGFSLPAFET